MKAKTFLFLGIVLVAAGAFPAAFYLGQLAWQVIGMFQARAFALPGARPDQTATRLQEVFNLEDQLAAL